MKHSKRSLVLAFIVVGSVSACGEDDQSIDRGFESVGEPVSVVGANCLDAVVTRLGISMEMETDPAEITTTLAEEMHLGELPSKEEIFGDLIAAPQSMRPMLQAIIAGVDTYHPAIQEFLCVAMERGLIPAVAPGEPMVVRTLHNMMVLNRLVQEMARDWTLMSEVHTYLLGKREELGIRPDFIASILDIYKITGEIFEPVKAKTMDWVFNEYDTIRSTGVITPTQIRARQIGTSVNILEAVITDRIAQNRDNALTGLAMAINPARTLAVTGENREVSYYFAPGWASLYQSWNLAFITGNLDNLDLLYPKLLIPQVMNADGDSYMFNRVLALWTSINFFLFRKAEGKPDVVFLQGKDLARPWGEINAGYGKNLFEQQTGLNPETLTAVLRLPYRVLKRLVPR